jgi:hypothetical protein
MATIIHGYPTPEQWRLERQRERNYFLIEAVKKYSDYRCITPDRTFYMVSNDDAEKLGHLILAEGSTNRLHEDDREWLEEMAGAICSSDDCDVSCAPLIYSDEAELIRAWKELHAISGLRMSTADEEELDERLEWLPFCATCSLTPLRRRFRAQVLRRS